CANDTCGLFDQLRPRVFRVQLKNLSHPSCSFDWSRSAQKAGSYATPLSIQETIRTGVVRRSREPNNRRSLLTLSSRQTHREVSPPDLRALANAPPPRQTRLPSRR